MTMDHELVLENSSSAAIYILPNTINLFAGHKIFEYQTETDLLNRPGAKDAKD